MSGYSLAQQIEALKEYAAREGYEVLEEIIDPEQRGASLERPGMDRAGLGSNRRCFDGLGTGPGPLRTRARLPVPLARGVRRVRDGRSVPSTTEVRTPPKDSLRTASWIS